MHATIQPAPSTFLDVLKRYLSPHRSRSILLTCLLLTGIGLQLLSPQLIRRFIDSATVMAPLSILRNLALIYLAVQLLRLGLNIAARYISVDLGWAATNALRRDLTEHILHLDATFHNTHTAGSLIERVDGDVNALANFFSEMIINIFGNMLLLLGVLVVLALEDWHLGLAFFVFALIVLLILGRMRDIATPHLQAERQASSELFGFIEERLAGTEDVRANGASGWVLSRFTAAMKKVATADFKAYMKIAQIRTTTFALFAMGGISALVFGATFYRSGIFTLGTVYLLYAYVDMLLRPVERIALEIQDFQKAAAGMLRVMELQNIKSNIHYGNETLPVGPLSVAFQNVSFNYNRPSEEESTNKALSDVTFALHAGRSLGIVGRTGSGKTSLTRLLLRLYDPTSGTIQLGGREIRSIRLESLRERVAVVTQEVQLFNATIRENLTLFDPSIPDEKIINAIVDVGLKDWLDLQPNGLDTILASGGDLSAGQAQLLAFTRVFLRDPGLVILDEASSRLDPATESLIENAVTKLLKDRTAIIIAHRLNTLDRVDDILVMGDGRVLEFGPREQLKAESDLVFSSLLKQGFEEVTA